MKNIHTTICYSPNKDDDIDKLIQTLEYIKSEYIYRNIKILNKPTIVLEIEENV